MSATRPLNVLIVGTGIAGLTAAVALRQQGHVVTIFNHESDRDGINTLVHITPNVNGILKRLGLDVSTIGATPVQRIVEFSDNSHRTRTRDLSEFNEMWQHDWFLVQSAHLRALLRSAATESGRGQPVEFREQSNIANIAPESGSVVLQGGMRVSGDIVIATDSTFISLSSKTTPSRSAFHAIIRLQVAEADAATRLVTEKSGQLSLIYGPGFHVATFPSPKSDTVDVVGVHSGVSAEDLVQTLAGTSEALRTLFTQADETSLKTWTLAGSTPNNWRGDGKLVLIHAATSTPASHGAVGNAIEDAISIAVLMEPGIGPGDVPARLQLYQDIRHERATRIQQQALLCGVGEDKDAAADLATKHLYYSFGHDEFDNTTQKLREWKWASVPLTFWRMPIAFGPMPGPRQSHWGNPRDGVQSTLVSASIKFKTSRTILQNLFPPGYKKYRFQSPGTYAYCSFTCVTLDKMEWLGGTGYNHMGLYIHGVEHENEDGDIVTGTYMPILFESLTDPIVSGREELGMPKLYTAIEVRRGDDSYNINTGWRGSWWGKFKLEGLKPTAELKGATGKVSGEDDDGILVYRYIPKVGMKQRGKSEADYPVFAPYVDEFPQPVIKNIYKADTAQINIDAMDWTALPTLHHIVGRLAEIPVYEIVSAKVVEATGVSDVRSAKRLE